VQRLYTICTLLVSYRAARRTVHRNGRDSGINVRIEHIRFVVHHRGHNAKSGKLAGGQPGQIVHLFLLLQVLKGGRPVDRLAEFAVKRAPSMFARHCFCRNWSLSHATAFKLNRRAVRLPAQVRRRSQRPL
jgi:hypothetical protein